MSKWADEDDAHQFDWSLVWRVQVFRAWAVGWGRRRPFYDLAYASWGFGLFMNRPRAVFVATIMLRPYDRISVSLPPSLPLYLPSLNSTENTGREEEEKLNSYEG